MKKGQVTLFILLGIIIISIATYLFYIEEQNAEFKPLPPQYYSPLKTHIEQCISSLAYDGLAIMGRQSGFIEVPGEIKNEGAYIHLIGPFILPYWYHNGNDLSPSEALVKEQLQGFIESSLESCINTSRFSYLELEAVGRPRVTVSLNEDDVLVGVDQIIRIRKDQRTASISSFAVSVPVRIRKALRLARYIMADENKNAFLEQATLSFMSADDIPLTGLEFSCRQKQWPSSEVESNLKSILRYSLPKVRFTNTLQVVSNTSHKYLTWNAVKEPLEMSVGLLYQPNWGLDMKARPNGEVLSSAMLTAEGLPLCVNTYHFEYDIVYPVEVIIRDDYDQGYSFRFAFPVLISHNKAERSLRLENSDSACKKMNTEVEITVYDKLTGQPLEEAEVTADCPDGDCLLGKTDDNGRLRARAPACSELVIARSGYMDGRVTQTPTKKEVYMARRITPKLFLEDHLGQTPEATAVMYLTSEGSNAVQLLDTTAENRLEIESPAEYDLKIYLMRNETLVGGFFSRWSINRTPDRITFRVYDARKIGISGYSNITSFLDMKASAPELMPLLEGEYETS
ncbi:hypothetical protein AUJ69_00625 [Candidatus Woesearchaeota archaeon CG1_02_47_18]|nr:MAG: hypothetical protein AUJ69_00625 [Candidatus Woesearchaeota archaeon CG1_02_47_18]HII29737.1 hypothetical protein [Candidatus Woesearchaeota archaeon]